MNAETTSMRKLIEKTIIDNWKNGYEEMTNVAHVAGWDRPYTEDGDKVLIGKWTLTISQDDEQLRDCVRSCSDKALLTWLEAQYCLIYR